jgi:glycolate oxidase FAD binding subunit
MADDLKPRDDKDVQETVRWALAEGKTLEIAGRGSKRGLGRPSQSDLTLDLSGLSGVTLYEPEELVLSAKAGTPIAEIEALVESKGQQLAFEPMDYGPLLGVPPNSGTLGGALAANLSGPRRIKAGAARDHFLGVSAVSGRGELFKSGGRVVKNVTGYDLCKLLAGSFGTLAVMTDVTIKVLPRPETEETVLVLGLDDAGATKAMADVMGSSCEVSAAAHLPSAMAGLVEGLPTVKAVTAFRLEGVPPSVQHRKAALVTLVAPLGAVEIVDHPASGLLWKSLRDAKPFWPDGPSGSSSLWRLSVAPARGHELAKLLPQGSHWYYDWAGGLVWAALPAADDAGASAIRRAMAAIAGHAMLVRAEAAIRATVDVFEPQSGPVAAVSRRVKEGFDPKGVLNPGRMWAGV